jgi:hypothetical protein
MASLYGIWLHTTKNEEYKILSFNGWKINQDGLDCKRAIYLLILNEISYTL